MRSLVIREHGNGMLHPSLPCRATGHPAKLLRNQRWPKGSILIDATRSTKLGALASMGASSSAHRFGMLMCPLRHVRTAAHRGRNHGPLAAPGRAFNTYLWPASPYLLCFALHGARRSTARRGVCWPKISENCRPERQTLSDTETKVELKILSSRGRRWRKHIL